MANKEKIVACSFCGKDSTQVERIIIGPGVNICNECVSLCCELLEDEGLLEPQRDTAQRKGRKKKDDEINILSPMQIKQGLDKYVIGQDEAKIALSVAVTTITKEYSAAIRLTMLKFRKATFCC